jgi:uncharacterized protein
LVTHRWVSYIIFLYLLKKVMETPFIFGKIASDRNFTDREIETGKLVQNFLSQVNTVIISPRRWGKSSLVAKSVQLARRKDKSIRFCIIDLNNVRTEEEFYKHFATKILVASSLKTRILIENTRKFLGRFIPNIIIGSVPGSEIKLGLNLEEVKKEPDDILNLAEKIGNEHGIKFVICIDEFQNISEFENPVDLQKKLRTHWQTHKNVSYCLYGSKRHMMMEVFTSPSMPFYKFGEVLFLDKISDDDWISFIIKRFSETGKKITAAEAGMIPALTDCHPYYVQQLAQQSWLRTNSACTGEIITAAFNDLVLQMSMLFQNLTDGLSRTQLGFLKAVTDNVEQMSSQSVINEYKLGTSANVAKIKKTLVNKEIIDIHYNKIMFLDPLYKVWLKDYFFIN